MAAHFPTVLNKETCRSQRFLQALSLLSLTFLSGAQAQQHMPVTFAPVTIDGVTTPRGIVQIGGKTYVAVDVLKARGVTLLRAGSLGLYAFPNGQGRAVQLKGCAGEWLNNGVARIRFEPFTWDTLAGRWSSVLTLQVPENVHSANLHFDARQLIAVTRSGRVFQPSKDALQSADLEAGSLPGPRAGANNTGTLILRDPNLSSADPIVKLMLPSATGDGSGKGTLTVDLSCKKS